MAKKKPMTVQQFCELMSIHRNTLMAWIRDGRVPGAKKNEDGPVRYWEIPESAATKIKRPRRGRRPKRDDEENNSDK